MEIKNIPNQIIKQSLIPLNLKKVDTIALHHMAHPTADVKTVEDWHINQGWRAFGYNFWVAFDGTVYEGRGFNMGAGVENQNEHIISIGFQGDYHSESTQMPDAQFNAGIDIISYVLEKVPTVSKICGHKDCMATECPGKYFPLEEIKTLKKRGKKKMIYNKIEECPEWSRPYIQTAINLGYLKGDGNGLGLNDDRIWCLVVMLRVNGVMK